MHLVVDSFNACTAAFFAAAVALLVLSCLLSVRLAEERR